MNAQRDEISFRELVGVIRRGKWIIACITGAFAIGAGVAASLLPKEYTATVVVSPVSNKANGALGGLSALASQLGGVASLTGLSVRGDSDRSETIAVLQSGVLTERYIRERNLLPILYAKKWDASNKRWKVINTQQLPTLWTASEFFRDNVRDVSENPKTGLVTVTVTWTEPKLAAEWANDLVRMTNDYLRNQAIEKSERHIAYLNDQAAKTDIAQLRTAIYTILESEIKNVMLAKGSDEYALKVIDPAVTPERKSAPRRLAWIAVGFLSGLSISLLFVFVRKLWSQDRWA